VSPYEVAVGLRYTRARKGSGRNSFISFISLISMAGIALGVAALIVVLSVMNGFQLELRNRILSVASHIEIRGFPDLKDAPGVAAAARQNPRVVATAPYVTGQAMLASGEPPARFGAALLPILVGRRQKLLDRYLSRLSPLADPVLQRTQEGTDLCATDLSVQTGASAAVAYRASFATDQSPVSGSAYLSLTPSPFAPWQLAQLVLAKA